MNILRIDASNHRLRRVGRLARRRMRIDGDRLRDGVHTDGDLSVELTGLAPGSGPALIRWQTDRPVALVIVRSGSDGDDVTFRTGPVDAGVIDPSSLRGGKPITYIAFCYDMEPEPASTSASGALARSILARVLPSGSPA